MTDRTFGEELILAEERRRERASAAAEGDRPKREVLIIERENFDESRAFAVHDGQHALPIDGPGELGTFLLIADQDTFGVRVEVDDQVVLDDSFSNLQEDTVDLARISAYQRTGDDNYVVAASNYPFRERLHIRVFPSETTTFDRQRAEIDREVL